MKEIMYIPGDLVIVGDRIATITESHGFNYYMLDTQTLGEYAVDVHNLKSVPLTPQILEANGWKTQNKWYYFLGINKGFIGFLGINFEYESHENPKRILYVDVDGHNIAEIQYCHQLQHLLFGLGLNSELKV